MNSESQGRIVAAFQYRSTIRNPDGSIVSRRCTRNLFPIQGRNYMLSAGIAGGQQVTQWYIGLFGGNYTPNDNDTAQAFPQAAQEITAYAETTRGLLVANPVAGGELDSQGHEVVRTLNADALVYGAFIASSQPKGSTGGILLSAARFDNPQQGHAGQTVTIGAVCTLINV